jgi:hypothetical protein
MTVTKTTRPQRATRKPLHQRGPLSINGDTDPNFHYRFVNDRGSRISNHTEAGWEMVTDEALLVGDSRAKDASDLGTAKSVTSDDGTVSYLMRIKNEYYEEDRAAKQALVDDQERALKPDASQGTYGTIKVS